MTSPSLWPITRKLSHGALYGRYGFVEPPQIRVLNQLRRLMGPLGRTH
jgi:hypothetical protein